MTTPRIEIKTPTHQPKGLQNRGIEVLTCLDCDTPLLSIQMTANTEDLVAAKIEPVTTRIKVCCGICAGSSRVAEFTGLFHVGAPNDQMGFEPIGPDADGVEVFQAWRKS